MSCARRSPRCSGFIETLQGTAKDDPAARAKFLAIMQGQATRMARLIDDLLSLSRIELNAHLQPNTPLDLAPIVRQVADGLQTLARDRDVVIKVAAPPDAADRARRPRRIDPRVRKSGGECAQIRRRRQADRHYAERAAKRAPVRRRRAWRYATTVPGIAPEHLPRLTERFYRVDVADSRAQGGTGLGLALVKHVLNRHGGRLNIESTPGAGATFTMHLPLHTGNSRATSEFEAKSISLNCHVIVTKHL